MKKTMLMSLALVVVAIFIVGCAPGEAIAGQAIRGGDSAVEPVEEVVKAPSGRDTAASEPEVNDAVVEPCVSDNTLIAYCKGTVLQNLSTDSCTGESTIIAEKDCALNFFGDPIDQSCFKVKGMPGY